MGGGGAEGRERERGTYYNEACLNHPVSTFRLFRSRPGQFRARTVPRLEGSDNLVFPYALPISLRPVFALIISRNCAWSHISVRATSDSTVGARTTTYMLQNSTNCEPCGSLRVRVQSWRGALRHRAGPCEACPLPLCARVDTNHIHCAKFREPAAVRALFQPTSPCSSGSSNCLPACLSMFHAPCALSLLSHNTIVCAYESLRGGRGLRRPLCRWSVGKWSRHPGRGACTRLSPSHERAHRP